MILKYENEPLDSEDITMFARGVSRVPHCQFLPLINHMNVQTVGLIWKPKILCLPNSGAGRKLVNA